MRAIASRIETIGFSGNSAQAQLRNQPGSIAWQVPTGAIERRVFEISTSAQLLQSGVATVATSARPMLEVFIGQTAAGVFSGTLVALLPLGVRVPASFSLEPGMFVGVRCQGMPASITEGCLALGCVLSYERQA